jgi:hypothetical protein
MKKEEKKGVLAFLPFCSCQILFRPGEPGGKFLRISFRLGEPGGKFLGSSQLSVVSSDISAWFKVRAAFPGKKVAQ